MKDYDVWFCRHDNSLWYVLAYPGDGPLTLPTKCLSPGSVFRAMKSNGLNVVQVGICDNEMLGLV